MEVTLTVYLLRTLCSKPKGLKVKLRIVRVNSSLVTFEEKDNPAAIIMSHGLFLAMPTQAAVKNPMLLAVLNQSELRDYEPDSTYRVFTCSENKKENESEFGAISRAEMQVCLGKRLMGTKLDEATDHRLLSQHTVGLVRHGMAKQLPNPIIADSMTDIRSGSHYTHTILTLEQKMIDYQYSGSNELLSQLTAYPVSLADIFVGLMRQLLCIYKQNKIVSSSMSPEINKGTPAAKNDEHLSAQFFQIMLFCETAINGLCFDLQNQREFLSPRPENDHGIFDSTCKVTHEQMKQLECVISHLLMRPLVAILSKITPEDMVEKSVFFGFMCEQIEKTKGALEYNIRLANPTPLHYQGLSMMGSFLQNPSMRVVYDLPSYELRRILRFVAIRDRYFDHLEKILDYFAQSTKIIEIIPSILNPNNHHVAGSIDVFKNSFLSSDFSQIQDSLLSAQSNYRHCAIHNSKGGQSVRFSPTLAGVKDYKIEALVRSGETTICIITQQNLVNEQPQPHGAKNFIFHVKVLRHELEIASFEFSAEIFRKKFFRVSHELVQYFTGRYFLRVLNVMNSACNQNLLMIDLQPCWKACPGAPIVSAYALRELLGDTENTYIPLGLTDRFISFLSWKTTPPQHDMAEAILRLVYYENMGKADHLLNIPIPPDLSGIFTGLVKNLMNSGSNLQSRASWSTNRQLLYCTDWLYNKSMEECDQVVIVCFGVSRTLLSAEILAHYHSNLSGLTSKELYSVCDPKFFVLKIQKRDYLVLDLVWAKDSDTLATRHSRAILARLLFTVHKNKIHRVPINGQLVYSSPWHIGRRMGYPGYETSQPSVFHHRRVFAFDKVICVIHRLNYKAV